MIVSQTQFKFDNLSSKLSSCKDFIQKNIVHFNTNAILRFPKFNNAEINTLRKIIYTEFEMYYLNVTYIQTDDEYISTDLIIERMRIIPIDQKIAESIYNSQNNEFKISLKNDSASNHLIYYFEKITDDKGKHYKLFNTLHLLSLFMKTSIEIKFSIDKNKSGEISNFPIHSFIPLDVKSNPEEGKRIQIQTNGNIELSSILSKISNIIEKQSIPNFLETLFIKNNESHLTILLDPSQKYLVYLLKERLIEFISIVTWGENIESSGFFLNIKTCSDDIPRIKTSSIYINSEIKKQLQNKAAINVNPVYKIKNPEYIVLEILIIEICREIQAKFKFQV